MEKNKGNFAWFFLGLIAPIVGIILFCVWKDEQPKNAKYILLGGIIGFILSIILIFVFFNYFLYVFIKIIKELENQTTNPNNPSTSLNITKQNFNLLK